MGPDSLFSSETDFLCFPRNFRLTLVPTDELEIHCLSSALIVHVGTVCFYFNVKLTELRFSELFYFFCPNISKAKTFPTLMEILLTIYFGEECRTFCNFVTFMLVFEQDFGELSNNAHCNLTISAFQKIGRGISLLEIILLLYRRSQRHFSYGKGQS